MKKNEFKSVENLMENLSPSELAAWKKKAIEAVNRSDAEGIPIYQALDIPKGMLDFTYGEAYRMYKSGLYEKAQQYFEFLFFLDKENPNYMLGLAASLQMRKYYASAIRVYDLMTFILPDSPMPYFYIYECCMQLNNYDDAKLALETVIQKAEGYPEGGYEALSQKARTMLEQHNTINGAPQQEEEKDK